MNGVSGGEVVVVAAQDLERIMAEAESAWPVECCGLLVGRELKAGTDAFGPGLRVTRVQPARNLLAEARKDRFEVDPQVRIDLERDLREQDRERDGEDEGAERLIGHYHSHPEGSAYPSATDVEQAHEPDLIWLIVPVLDGRAHAPGAFRINRARAQIETLSLQAA